MRKLIVGIGLLVVAIGGLAAWNRSRDEDEYAAARADMLQRVRRGPFRFDGEVDELAAAYADNELAANQRYLGGALKVKGWIRRVTADASGLPVVFLQGRKAAYNAPGSWSQQEIVCRYAGDAGTLQAIAAGQLRTVHGLGGGVGPAGPILDVCAIEPP